MLKAQTKKQRHREPRNDWADDPQGMGLLEVAAIKTIHGRSIPNQFQVVDVEQNQTPPKSYDDRRAGG